MSFLYLSGHNVLLDVDVLCVHQLAVVFGSFGVELFLHSASLSGSLIGTIAIHFVAVPFLLRRAPLSQHEQMPHEYVSTLRLYSYGHIFSWEAIPYASKILYLLDVVASVSVFLDALHGVFLSSILDSIL